MVTYCLRADVGRLFGDDEGMVDAEEDGQDDEAEREKMDEIALSMEDVEEVVDSDEMLAASLISSWPEVATCWALRMRVRASRRDDEEAANAEFYRDRAMSVCSAAPYMIRRGHTTCEGSAAT